MPQIDVAGITALLGGEPVIGRPVHSISDLNALVVAGLPKQSLRIVARWVFPDPKRRSAFIHSIVPEATFKRRRLLLSTSESKRTERLARITAMASSVWADQDDAREFLTTPHAMLDGDTPIEHATTDLGARQVEQILRSIEHGLPV
jgi:putative toxin-antitoxin system antitoxin component (TIGR02293 family)